MILHGYKVICLHVLQGSILPPAVQRNGWTEEKNSEQDGRSDKEGQAQGDNIVREIQERITRKISMISMSTTLSEMQGAEEVEAKTSDNFASFQYGFQPKASYEHSKKETDIMGGGLF